MHIKTKNQASSKVYGSKIYLLTLLNEKHTSWEFCMRILTEVFHKSVEEATIITQNIQNDGEGMCGAYTFEIAETKAAIVERLAKQEQFSLHCLLEQI
jgi:ATP-dependent Clp protease adaptor protein ClpS